MSDDRIPPLPEIIFPGPWKVRHLPRGGHASRASRTFAAPLDDTPFARAIRAHEYAHVRFSPDRPRNKRHRVALDTLLAVEDARVNECAARSGLAEVLLEIDDPAVRPPSPTVDLRGATLFLVAAHRTGAYARALARLGAAGDAGRLACHLAARAIGVFTAPAGLPDFRVTIAVARMLDRALGGAGGDPVGRAGRGEGEGALCGVHCLIHAEEGLPGAGFASGEGRPSRSVEWGDLRVLEQPPLSVLCRDARCARGNRATEEGTELRSPHRLLVDRRVFTCRRRLPGGSVLIDASGSMRLSKEGLLRIVAGAAGALIACYDGASEGWGALRVLARGGRRVADRLVAPPTGRGGNVVDGPALRWLARQPAPRVWVSDGAVTGIGDRSSATLTWEAGQICRAARITRVKDLPSAIEVLHSARGRPGATAGGAS